MKNKGFSLIELLVVLGIIGVLSSFITPKVMNYLAKGKDTKAVAVLESLRTASQLYYLEEGKSFFKGESYGEITVEQFEKLEKYLSNNARDLIKNNKVVVEIGGSKDSPDSKDIKYGGEIGFTTQDPKALEKSDKSDGINIWFNKTNEIKDFNLSGNKWVDL
ncbi:type II secretion system protein [Fusobacterium sp.]|uniref:type II secretion system protein n=1 Tax=Fusobacterium sp. TaxID=68766 RepID=UPI002630A151|nr:prepilin-type N-terminal cleavage/methylation domain-containing protein [Fusobacterium sp.]